MQYKIIILILLFYFLALFQNSFFVHLNIYGVAPDLVFILVCLVSFFFSQGNVKSHKKDHNRHTGLILTIFAGFLADIFSPSFFGISIVSFLAVYFFIKKSVDLLIDISGGYQVVYFLPIFIVSLVLYNFLAEVLLYFSGYVNFYFFSNGYFLLINLAYNLVFAIIGFYIFKVAKDGL